MCLHREFVYIGPVNSCTVHISILTQTMIAALVLHVVWLVALFNCFIYLSELRQKFDSLGIMRVESNASCESTWFEKLSAIKPYSYNNEYEVS